MIPRFLSPTRGRILFDGRDVAAATLASVRAQVAFVFQEQHLFDISVEENIRALLEGYATRLGRAGGKLSVGQKQRLAIARALVREAPILILDEPTSALDPDTERRLVAALREAARTRLVRVIAHRLSTVRQADQILFLQDGRILERGDHDALMADADGAYRRYVELQSRGAA